MDILQLLVVIASVAAFLYFFVLRLEKDMDKISDKLDKITDRLDNDFRHITAMQAQQSKRTDDLYNIIVDMLNKGK